MKTRTLPLQLAEGLFLAAYEFAGYKTDAKSRAAASLTRLTLAGAAATPAQVTELQNLLEGAVFARDLVNAPLNKLNAQQLADRLAEAGDAAGYTTDILDLAHIESPAHGRPAGRKPRLARAADIQHSGMEARRNAQNEHPYVLVGKGVVYDTGGLSLKPTPNSMDLMKCDMAGGAAVGGVLYALAKNQVPLHVIGLVPATDNRPGGLAYVPGDVLTMHAGLTVEVKNTDAEGRLLLADALSFATQIPPRSWSLTSLPSTGAAVRAVGTEATAVMGTADADTTAQPAGRRPPHARAPCRISALGRLRRPHEVRHRRPLATWARPKPATSRPPEFLERFIEGTPWLHLDIAGPAFLTAADSYRGKGGTGTGVRPLYEFLIKQWPNRHEGHADIPWQSLRGFQIRLAG
ncbi:MAG: peptidase M17 [Hymenobacter sp.]